MKAIQKSKKVARERLLRCVFDVRFCRRIMWWAAVQRATNPRQLQKMVNLTEMVFEQIASTALCVGAQGFSTT
jgi:hypothetical protein